jgi:hypothetical protein
MAWVMKRCNGCFNKWTLVPDRAILSDCGKQRTSACFFPQIIPCTALLFSCASPLTQHWFMTGIWVHHKYTIQYLKQCICHNISFSVEKLGYCLSVLWTISGHPLHKITDWKRGNMKLAFVLSNKRGWNTGIPKINFMWKLSNNQEFRYLNKERIKMLSVSNDQI